MQTTVELAVYVGATAEDGLRAFPILTPLIQKFQLSFAEKNGLGGVDVLRFVVWIENVVGAWALSWDQAHWSGFEFAIFEDGETDAPKRQVCVIGADAALNGCRIVGIRQMPSLGALHGFDIGCRHDVAAVGAAPVGRHLSGFSPEVGLTDIVIIRNGDRRAVACDVTEIMAKAQPMREM